jgi:hypothetical protein
MQQNPAWDECVMIQEKALIEPIAARSAMTASG